jgi:hypothetical protein
MNSNAKLGMRSCRGQALAETAGLLAVFFIFLTFPLMNLGAIGMRAFFVVNSAKVGAERACKSLTYRAKADIPDGTLANNTPAETVARNEVQRYLNSFSGAKLVSVKTGIVDINNITGEKTGPFYTTLSSLPQENHSYYIDVQVNAETDPLLSYKGGMLGDIPGLTRPFPLSMHGQRVFENPKGLQM